MAVKEAEDDDILDDNEEENVQENVKNGEPMETKKEKLHHIFGKKQEASG